GCRKPGARQSPASGAGLRRSGARLATPGRSALSPGTTRRDLVARRRPVPTPPCGGGTPRVLAWSLPPLTVPAVTRPATNHLRSWLEPDPGFGARLMHLHPDVGS